jgi:hypothetical protein
LPEFNPDEYTSVEPCPGAMPSAWKVEFSYAGSDGRKKHTAYYVKFDPMVAAHVANGDKVVTLYKKGAGQLKLETLLSAASQRLENRFGREPAYGYGDLIEAYRMGVKDAT